MEWKWKRLAAAASIVLTAALVSGAPRTARAGPPTPEQRLDHAAEALLAGRLDEARTIVDTFPADARTPPPGSKPWMDEAEAATRRDLQWQLLHAAIDPSAADAFDLVARLALESDPMAGRSRPVQAMPWLEVFTRYASREGYAEAAHYLLSSALDRRDPEEEKDLRRLLATLPGSAAAPAPAADSVGEALRRRLAAPPCQPYEEKPLAPAFAPLHLTEDEEERRAEAALSPFRFPEEFGAVRAEAKGGEVVAIGTSQDYDPVGETSAGAYWLIRSHDGGKTWGKPVYTGLRVHLPYLVRPVSNAPLLDGDHLRIEVEVAEIDPASITFPPIETRLLREQKDLLLRVSFADLEKDTDGDGLTDLAEDRLLTDPKNPDTDGDGVPDGRDALPLVPLGTRADERATALAAVLRHTTGTEELAIIDDPSTGVPGDAEIGARARPAVLSSERTLFVLGDRRDYRGLVPTRRVVVLTQEELAFARKKFGTTYPYEIPFFLLDHEKRRGVVVWDASWEGGALRLHQGEKGWEVEVVTSWIT